MTVADVIINKLCKMTVSITTEDQSIAIFDGQGYPDSYGFCSKSAGYWVEEFVKPSSNFKMENRGYYELYTGQRLSIAISKIKPRVEKLFKKR